MRVCFMEFSKMLPVPESTSSLTKSNCRAVNSGRRSNWKDITYIVEPQLLRRGHCRSDKTQRVLTVTSCQLVIGEEEEATMRWNDLRFHETGKPPDVGLRRLPSCLKKNTETQRHGGTKPRRKKA